MPCEKCGTDRIITTQRILCPNCDHIVVVDAKKVIENRKQKMEEIDRRISMEMDSTDYNQTFGSAIVNREIAAKAIVSLPVRRTHAVKEWLAYTYVLRNLEYSKNSEGLSNFSETVELSREMVRLRNEIYRLDRKLAVLVRSGDEEKLEWTEHEPLSFVPEEVYRHPNSKMILDGINDREINLETTMFQEALMLPISIVLLSEDISRILKRCYHSRILPFIKNSSQATKFVEISLDLAIQGFVSNTSKGVDEQFEGLLMTDEVGLQQTKQNLWHKFHSDDVKWYFRSLMNETCSDKFDLSCSIIVKDKQLHLICLPLYSLMMLGHATVKWMKTADLGRTLNLKGEVVEDYFFRFVNAYDLSTEHPITRKPLLRVEHPTRPTEIADIMGYNDKNVLVLECKFWNTPTLLELEEQLAKFREKVHYIQSNLEKFGFDADLKVIPVFYTPYAPYPSWHGISILPTAFEVGMKIGEIFPPKKVKLIPKVPGLEKLFELVNGPLPFPIDASHVLDSLPQDRYRIHDGLVLKFDETELTTLIDLPVSQYAFFTYLDITNDTFEELNQKGVFPGDVLRMVTVNLSGTWTITQLLLFRKIMERSEWESHPEKAKPYNRMISLFRYLGENRVSNG